MDCVKGALKSSFVPEMKTTQNQDCGDDLWAAGNGQNVVAADDFSVDDLLDFSNDFVENQEEQQQQQQGEDNDVAHKTSKQPDCKEAEKQNDIVPLPEKQDFVSLPASELSVPADELESLEWLSHFVEDSFCGYSLTYPAGKPAENQLGEETPVQVKSCFTTPVQTKARTKRGRASVRVWPAGPGSLTETSSSSSSSSTTLSSSSPTNGWVLYPTPVHFAEPPLKKMKKGPVVKGEPRRCSHCGVQKTPQWRAGPMGAKTLCNACGVRFKSGRLLPEYRPACSPTFSTELHSNSHRKVLEMRRKKELEETGLTNPVQSF